MKQTKVIVAGGRYFIGTYIHEEWLENTLVKMNATHVISGMARGADMFGFNVAKKLGYKTIEFPADWNMYGKSAGYKRNLTMADFGDAVILFPGGKGTQHMKNIAIEKGLEIVEYEEPESE